jgi:hypothetical protein
MMRVAANVRVGDPLFETVFPVLFGVVVRVGIFLREERLRAFFPLRSSSAKTNYREAVGRVEFGVSRSSYL